MSDRKIKNLFVGNTGWQYAVLTSDSYLKKDDVILAAKTAGRPLHRAKFDLIRFEFLIIIYKERGQVIYRYGAQVDTGNRHACLSPLLLKRLRHYYNVKPRRRTKARDIGIHLTTQSSSFPVICICTFCILPSIVRRIQRYFRRTRAHDEQRKETKRNHIERR